MNILIVTQYFWPESFRINDLAIGLVEKGHTVTVLTGIPNYPYGKFFSGYGLGKKHIEVYRGIKIIRVPLFPRGKAKGWQLTINYLSFMLSASVLSPIFCRGNYDLIFVAQFSPVTVGIPAIILKKIKKIPIFFWIQDLWPESLSATGAVKSPTIINRVAGLVSYIYNQCDTILVQSKGFISQVNKLAKQQKQIEYLPNWAEEIYQPADKLVAAQLDMVAKELPKGFIVMFAGNLGVAQDFTTILKAAEQLKTYDTIHWVVVGDGREKVWIEDQIKRRNLGKQVHLLGRHPVEMMPYYFAHADVMLVTLKREPIFALTVPSKVQSYMACGKPIVAALEGEGAKVIEEAGAGIVCSPEDSNALAESVVSMYRKTASELKDMGTQAQRYYKENFERNKLISQLECSMQDVVNKSKKET